MVLANPKHMPCLMHYRAAQQAATCVCLTHSACSLFSSACCTTDSKACLFDKLSTPPLRHCIRAIMHYHAAQQALRVFGLFEQRQICQAVVQRVHHHFGGRGLT